MDREDVFASTKLAAEIEDYEGAVAAIDESLTELDIGYLGVMLIHSPQPYVAYWCAQHPARIGALSLRTKGRELRPC